MNYKIPLYSSFSASFISLVLLYFGYPVIAQVFLVVAILMSLGAFKSRGMMISAISHIIPGIIFAYIYFTTEHFPLLSLSILLACIQNPFLEMFFPSLMYNNALFKIVTAIISISSYLISNILFPAGVAAWVFPGLALLMVNLLTIVILMDLTNLVKASMKGYITVGSPCPPFNLPDEAGTAVSSSDFKGKYLLMIFVRGDWCPGCHIMLRCYDKNREKFAERNVQLLSIGPDPLGVNKEMVQKLGLNYHVLSDEKQMLARQFCVELQEAGAASPGFDFVPLPASFLIDKEGIVRYTSRADKAGEILYPDQIFKVLDSLK